MDKKPMLLVASCGTSLPGEMMMRPTRDFISGSVVRTRSLIVQPKMHEMYWKNFNAVDLFNRDCFGNYTM